MPIFVAVAFLLSGLAMTYWLHWRAGPDLEAIVHHLGLALGGRPAATFAERLMMPISNDTLLRVVRRRTEPPRDKLVIVGIDDFAFRRGQRYGTIVCDLERRRPATSLPDREQATSQAWLSDHPSITTVARDRGGGYRFCRYADDCNIYVRSRCAGERFMASVGRFLTMKLRLTVNEAKSAVARPEEGKFLGFSISNDGSERRIAPKALDKFKTLIRDMTRRTRGISLPQLIKELKPYLIGWRGYFGFYQTPRGLTDSEAWGDGHNCYKELRRRGVPRFSAAAAAGSPTGFWRMSGHPAVQQALRNHYFESLGLPRLHVSA